jgi:hypothetical protein
MANTVDFLAALTARYPNANFPANSVKAYAEDLSGVKIDILMEALPEVVRRCKFFPTLADIFEVVDEIRASREEERNRLYEEERERIIQEQARARRLLPEAVLTPEQIAQRDATRARVKAMIHDLATGKDMKHWIDGSEKKPDAPKASVEPLSEEAQQERKRAMIAAYAATLENGGDNANQD